MSTAAAAQRDLDLLLREQHLAVAHHRHRDRRCDDWPIFTRVEKFGSRASVTSNTAASVFGFFSTSSSQPLHAGQRCSRSPPARRRRSRRCRGRSASRPCSPPEPNRRAPSPRRPGSSLRRPLAARRPAPRVGSRPAAASSAGHMGRRSSTNLRVTIASNSFDRSHHRRAATTCGPWVLRVSRVDARVHCTAPCAIQRAMASASDSGRFCGGIGTLPHAPAASRADLVVQVGHRVAAATVFAADLAKPRADKRALKAVARGAAVLAGQCPWRRSRR